MEKLGWFVSMGTGDFIRRLWIMFLWARNMQDWHRPTVLLISYRSKVKTRLTTILKSSIFWDIMPCSPLKVNRSFGGTWRLHLRGRIINQARNQRKTGSKQTFLAWLIFRPRRWRRHFPPERALTFNGLCGVISQKIEMFITTAVRTSNPDSYTVIKTRDDDILYNFCSQMSRWITSSNENNYTEHGYQKPDLSLHCLETKVPLCRSTSTVNRDNTSRTIDLLSFCKMLLLYKLLQNVWKI
jgi:hypothetical protein